MANAGDIRRVGQEILFYAIVGGVRGGVFGCFLIKRRENEMTITGTPYIYMWIFIEKSE